MLIKENKGSKLTLRILIQVRNLLIHNFNILHTFVFIVKFNEFPAWEEIIRRRYFRGIYDLTNKFIAVCDLIWQQIKEHRIGHD